mmetsp:Transcript_108449/g.188246  ORF Transcript_108449/g.188246 Transcript_108449/m.188246 type:complete len:250 (-) Transcript_108449:1125-1874(-)
MNNIVANGSNEEHKNNQEPEVVCLAVELCPAIRLQSEEGGEDQHEEGRQKTQHEGKSCRRHDARQNNLVRAYCVSKSLERSIFFQVFKTGRLGDGQNYRHEHQEQHHEADVAEEVGGVAGRDGLLQIFPHDVCRLWRVRDHKLILSNTESLVDCLGLLTSLAILEGDEAIGGIDVRILWSFLHLHDDSLLLSHNIRSQPLKFQVVVFLAILVSVQQVEFRLGLVRVVLDFEEHSPEFGIDVCELLHQAV